MIVTAYNRKEFLKQCVDSILNQTLDKSLYEIIIVKNFESPEDEDWKKKGIKVLLVSDLPIGNFFAKGVENSEANILAFADDDDLYVPNRLEKVLDVFKKYPEVSYFHNSESFVNKELQPIKDLPLFFTYKDYRIYDLSKENDIYSFVFSSEWFNMTSIVIKKEAMIKDLDLIKNITYNPDGLAMLMAVLNKLKAYGTQEKLTFYRIHGNNFSLIGENDFQKEQTNWERNKEVYMIFKNIAKRYENSERVLKIVDYRTLRDEANHNVLMKNNVNLKNYFFNYSLPYFKYNKKLDIFLIAVILNKLNKNYASKVLMKRMNIV